MPATAALDNETLDHLLSVVDDSHRLRSIRRLSKRAHRAGWNSRAFNARGFVWPSVARVRRGGAARRKPARAWAGAYSAGRPGRMQLRVSQRPVLGIETVRLLHRDPAGSLALGFGWQLAVVSVKGLRVAQTFGNVVFDIRGVFRGSRLHAFRLAEACEAEHEHEPADDRAQGQPIAQLHDAPRAGPR